MAVIRQTEEKDELPALWRNVCMREKATVERERGDINQLLVSLLCPFACVLQSDVQYKVYIPFLFYAYVCSPRCNQVLSTYDVSHMINFTRLFPFLFSFFIYTWGEPGN